MPRVLVLWGVPGVGKTTYAKHLVAAHGYVHVDTDAGGAGATEAAIAWRAVLRGTGDPEQFVEIALGSPDPIVMEYGMFANAQGITLLGRLRVAGAEPWWFDGDRQAAFEAWRSENRKARPHFVDAMWHNVVNVIDANYASLEAFFGEKMTRTIEAGPRHVKPEEIFTQMFGLAPNRRGWAREGLPPP